MKPKLLLLLLFAFSSYTSIAQNQSGGAFTLSGKLSGRDTGVICLDYLAKNGNEIRDSINLKNGDFRFSGVISGPCRAVILGKIKSHSVDDPNFTELYLAPGSMTIALQEDHFKDALIKGSVMQDDMYLLKKQKEINDTPDNNIGLEIKKTYEDQKSSTVNVKVLKAKRDSLYKAHQYYAALDKNIDYAFIASHPASYLSPELMEYYFGSRKLSLDSAEMFYNTFTAEVKSSVAGKYINDQIIDRKATVVGSVAPIFSKVDINGKTIDLASFRGKNYIMLDFWASWCVPCQQGLPHLKKIYTQYHPKGMEIISLSWDAKEKDWKDAINKDSIGMWHHVLANMYLPNDNSMRDKYAIEGIPTLILIDKTGVILARWSGWDESVGTDMDKKLAEVFAGK